MADPVSVQQETRETRLKRLRMRCWRRGTKEMDLLFGQFADEAMADLSDADLDAFEALMDEADDELYLWISRARAAPAHHAAALDLVRAHHKIG